MSDFVFVVSKAIISQSWHCVVQDTESYQLVSLTISSISPPSLYIVYVYNYIKYIHVPLHVYTVKSGC